MRRRGPFARLVAFLVLGAAGLAGCIYDVQLALPENIKKISVPLLVNETGIFQLDSQLTQEVRKRFMEDGRIQLVEVDQLPQGELKGAAAQYAKEPILMDPATSRIYKWRLRLLLRLEFTDLTKGSSLWKEPVDATKLPFETAYEYYEVGNPQAQKPETEDEAKRKLVELMSRRVVQRTLDGW